MLPRRPGTCSRTVGRSTPSARVRRIRGSSHYRNLARPLVIATIHALPHYSATELLTAGIDLRTAAGRLGPGGGGATTPRVYAAWVAATDRKAAEILASRMPKRPTQRHV